MNCPSKTLSCTAWTGLNDLDIEGTYVWDHSNAPLTFSNWNDKEPSLDDPQMAQIRDCIDILRGGSWNDRRCSYLNWVICEKSVWRWYYYSSDIYLIFIGDYGYWACVASQIFKVYSFVYYKFIVTSFSNKLSELPPVSVGRLSFCMSDLKLMYNNVYNLHNNDVSFHL